MSALRNRTQIRAIEQADAAGYAIPAFNYSDIWEMRAIADAAMEERATVYIASNMRVAETIGLSYLGEMGRVAYEQSGGHVINHLDHSSSVELCKEAVDHGYLSVMIDASMCSLADNIAQTREVVAYAHAHGVTVEAEIGRILGRNVEGTYLGDDYLVQVRDAVELVRETGVDTLAIGIGTAHGFYSEQPNIRLDRLREVNEAVAVPLVLHGGTGIPHETVRACIREGIAKVNVGTLLHATYISTLRRELGQKNDTNISDLMEPVKQAVKQVVKEWIHVCGAQNRY